MNKQEIENAIEIITIINEHIDFECDLNQSFRECFPTIISALEQQLNGGWIPVSERLPEENGHYLVTYHEWSKGEYLPKFDFTCVKILRFYRGEFEMPICCNDKIEQDIGREVIAWMPLPEPYREEAAQ